MSGTPFFRGTNAIDAQIAAAAVVCGYKGRADLMVPILSAYEPVEAREFDSPGAFYSKVYVAIGDLNVYILMDGTTTWQQMAGNVLGAGQLEYPHYPGKVHAYFSLNAGSAYDRIIDYVSPHIGTRSIVCAGHSLGGASVLLLGKRLATQFGRPLSVITFGAPRVGNQDWRDAMDEHQTVEFQAADDPVPNVPPRIWGPTWTLVGQRKLWSYDEWFHTFGEVGIGNDGQIGPPPPPMSEEDVAFAVTLGDGTSNHDSTDYLIRMSVARRLYRNELSLDGFADPDSLDPALRDLAEAIGHPLGIPAPMEGLTSAPPAQLSGGGMSLFKFTFFMDAEDFGWSETLYAEATDVTTAQTKAKAYCNMRRPLLGGGCKLGQYRVSDLTSKQSYGLFSSPNAARLSASDSVPESSHPWNAAILEICNGADRGKIFLRGLPKPVADGQLRKPFEAAWGTLLQKYRDNLISGAWKFRVQKKGLAYADQGPVTGIVAGPPVVITYPAKLGLAEGDIVRVSRVKLTLASGHTKPSCNALWAVHNVTATTAELVGCTLNGTFLAPGTWRKIAYDYLSITKTFEARLASRRPGRPFAVAAGRSRSH